MKTHVYFKVAKTKVDQCMLDCAIQTSPYTVREWVTDEVTYWLLKFEPNQVPLSMYELSLTPMNNLEAKAMLATENPGE